MPIERFGRFVVLIGLVSCDCFMEVSGICCYSWARVTEYLVGRWSLMRLGWVKEER